MTGTVSHVIYLCSIIYCYLYYFGMFHCPRDETPKCLYNVMLEYYSRPPWSLEDIYFDNDCIFVMFSYLYILFLSSFVFYPFICDVIKIYIYIGSSLMHQCSD